MNNLRTRQSAILTTLGFGLCVTIAGSLHPVDAKHMMMKPKPAKVSAAQIAKGKALVAKYRCNTCHGADLKGKKGFSPSLTAAGPLKHYNAKTWARVLDTGVTEDGKKVEEPMPVYHMAAKDSGPIYTYLKTLK